MSIEISQLPDLPLVDILSFISANERIGLRPVCKRWNFLVQCVKQVSLCVYGTRFPAGEYLAYKRQLNCDDAVRVGSAEAVPNVKSVLFNGVDYLYLYSIENSNFLSDLNRLLRLKELVIGRLNYTQPLTLTLPSLCVLCLKFSEFKQLELDTEQLTTFVFWGDFDSFKTISVHFRHPETVKVLEYQSYVIKNALEEFANLEHLTGVQEESSTIDLRHLPKLKTLDLVPRVRRVRNLDLDAIVLGIPQRPDLKIYCLGFKNRLFKAFTGYKTFETRMVGYPGISDYESLEKPIPFSFEISDSIEGIVRHFEMVSMAPLANPDNPRSYQEIPESFFRKVPYISSISMNVRGDSINCFDFLRKSRCPALCVTILHLNGAQEFFDQISRLTSITSLTIRDLPWCSFSFESNFFNFLSNMISLRTLTFKITCSKWPIASILEAVEKCRFFAELTISYNCHYYSSNYFVHIFFRPYTKELYYCKIGGQELPQNSVKELVRYLKENQTEKNFSKFQM